MTIEDSTILRHLSDRSQKFKTNPRLDALIEQLKGILEPLQSELNTKFSAPRYPVSLVIGNPRSGTTLATQLLAATGSFAYPTNVMSRFAYAPMIGALIQQILFNSEFDYLDELTSGGDINTFESNLGRTKGPLAVNQFFHFWRRFLPNYDPRFLSDEEKKLINISLMKSEIASIEHVFQKPFLSKAMMLQYNIRYLSNLIPSFIFIHVRRDPLFVMQSILESRRKFYQSETTWYSVKPREFDWLSKLDPWHQIAGQVLFTEREIDQQLDKLDEEHRLTWGYEDICADPGHFYDSLRAIYSKRGVELAPYKFSADFSCSNKVRLGSDDISRLEKAYESLSRDI